jgi:hypothetical protein
VSTKPAKAAQKRVKNEIARDKIGSMGDGRIAAGPDGVCSTFRRQDHNPSLCGGLRGFCRSQQGSPVPTTPQGFNKGKAA